MSSKGVKYIKMPLFVLNIGLLYVFLLTISHLLAWVTIARHEKAIEELREILVTRNDEQEKQPLSSAAVRGDMDDYDAVGSESSEVLKLLAVENAGERPRRHLNSNSKNNNSKHHSKDEKGDKGEKGDNGRDGRDGRDGIPGQQGKRGERGDTGIQGPRGFQGFPGPQGIPGPQAIKGARGGTGSNGSKGIKGDRGNEGRPGKVVRHPHSAHVVGTGGKIKTVSGNKLMSSKVKWKAQHESGKMHYKNGYLEIGTDGVFFVYSQMYYYDGTSSYIGYEVYIDDKKILKAVHSIASKTRKYQTQYTSGIFEISKGQRISVESPFAKYYYFNETLSFFGAFMLHE